MKITIGKSTGGVVKLDMNRLVASRLLVTAASGGGKSWLLRKILEEVSQTTQTLVIDTEGEFATLREKRDMVLAGPSGEVPAETRSAPLLCRRLMELNVSAVIDISELPPLERRRFVAAFCNTMVDLPRSLWRPCVVAIDETHEYAAEKEVSESSKAVALLGSKGRKRGYCLLAATQRLSKLAKDVAAEMKNQFIGQMTLDVDLKRAADVLGFPKERWKEIRDLSPPAHEGEFFCFGPALNHRGVVKFRAGQVQTTHPKAGQGRLASPPEPSKKVLGIVTELKDLPQQAEAEIRDLSAAKKKLADMERELRQRPTETKLQTETIEKIVEVPVLKNGQLERTEKLVDRLDAISEKMRAQTNAVAERVFAEVVELRRLIAPAAQKPAVTAAAAVHKPVATRTAPAPQPQTDPRPRQSDNEPAASSSVESGVRKILIALAQRDGLNNKQLGQRAGVSPNSSTFRGYLAVARRNEWIRDEGATRHITDTGLAALGEYERLPTGKELLAYWLDKLGQDSGEASIMRAAIARHPASMTYDELAAETGISATSSTFRGYLATLRKLELIVGKKGVVRASDELF